MKRFLVLLASLALAISANAQAATVTPPAATSHQVTLIWTSTCPQAMNCSFIPYRIGGTCPANLLSPGWTQLPTTAVNTGTAIDTSVTAATQYSYFVESVAMINGTPQNSGPSNCTTVTVPNGPSLATGTSATAS